MIIAKPAPVHMESYYSWYCHKCGSRLEGFDSDLPLHQCVGGVINIYKYNCPVCRQTLHVTSDDLKMETQGELY